MLDKKYRRIVVVTDGLSSSDSVHATAKYLAKLHGASLTLVDTVKTPSLLARWFSSNADDVFEMVMADKQNRLNELATMFDTAGIETDSKVLVGVTSESITKEVLESDADLVIRYKKGVHSRHPGALGNTARSLMRHCPVPLLFVGNEPVAAPKVLSCIDAEHDGTANTSVLDNALTIAENAEDLSAIYCWDMYAKDLLKNRMSPESYQESLDQNLRRNEQVFEKFQEAHKEQLANFKGGLHLEQGEPEFRIPSFAQQNDIDIVVMCSASLNHPLRRMIGSTVEAVIEKIECGLLVVKPVGYVSPLSE